MTNAFRSSAMSTSTMPTGTRLVPDCTRLYLRFLRRVYESGKAGDVNVMDGLIDLIGTDLGILLLLIRSRPPKMSLFEY